MLQWFPNKNRVHIQNTRQRSEVPLPMNIFQVGIGHCRKTLGQQRKKRFRPNNLCSTMILRVSGLKICLEGIRGRCEYRCRQLILKRRCPNHLGTACTHCCDLVRNCKSARRNFDTHQLLFDQFQTNRYRQGIFLCMLLVWVHRSKDRLCMDGTSCCWFRRKRNHGNRKNTWCRRLCCFQAGSSCPGSCTTQSCCHQKRPRLSRDGRPR